jgi:hypothetical protein
MHQREKAPGTYIYRCMKQNALKQFKENRGPHEIKCENTNGKEKPNRNKNNKRKKAFELLSIQIFKSIIRWAAKVEIT